MTNEQNPVQKLKEELMAQREESMRREALIQQLEVNKSEALWERIAESLEALALTAIAKQEGNLVHPRKIFNARDRYNAIKSEIRKEYKLDGNDDSE